MGGENGPGEIEVAPGLWISDLLCAWLPERKAVVVADLHLGFEAVAAADGACFPNRQKPVLLRRLGAILDRFRPSLVVSAGDFKHNFGKGARLEIDEVREVVEYLDSKADLSFVRGNHDNFLAGALPPGQSLPESIGLGRFRVAHGHREQGTPPKGVVATILAHEHPSLRLRDTVGGRSSAPAFLFEPATGTLVLPALSPLAPGSDILRARPLSPGLRASGLDGFRLTAATGEGLLDFGPVGALRKWEAE